MTQAVTLKWEGAVAVIDINDIEKPVNSFSREILDGLDKTLDNVFAKDGLQGLVISSSKPNCFAAGVDISIFDTLTSQKAGEEASATLHKLFNRFANANVPTVAAINGVCLGGGTELSLSCHYRVCSANPATQIGLPEIQLGLIPGGCGTQRLPRLVGIPTALDLILTGKKIDAKKAMKIGFADEVVPENQLISRAVSFCVLRRDEFEKRKQQMKNGKSILENMNPLENNPLGRMIVRSKATEQVIKNTKGHYPAAFKALDAVFKGIGLPIDKGLALEAKLFGELVVSSQSHSLIHIFRMMTAAKKVPYSADAKKWAKDTVIAPLQNASQSVGILGAGLMGSGVATVLADKNIRSVMLDRDNEGLLRGMKAVAGYFDERLKRRRIRRPQRDAAVYKVVPTTSATLLKGCPIIVEAVFEDVKIKHDILKRVEQAVGNSNFIFATNTSSLPISDVAAGASRPENVIGMHFFSPVPKMPLVEIIVTKQTRPEVAAATYDLALKMGKNVIVVNDGPGFYTTRILAFYIAEALQIILEGARMEDIDKALEKFGMPVGPITLLDEVGIDVGHHIMKVLGPAFGDRLPMPKEFEAVIAEDRKGRKNNKGFYRYENGKKAGPDESIYKHFSKGRGNADAADVVDRCAYVFLNEAARCLDEGIINSTDDGDMGAVFGLGFPPFLGGPFHWASTLGKKPVYDKLKQLEAKFGKRFTPAKFWKS